MSKAQAAVLWPNAKHFSIEDVELEEPRSDEVLVRIVASGICHTDVVLRDASIATRPVVLGHEGSGIVEKVGAGVTEFKVGDRVGMSFASCGQCPSCQQQTPAYCQQFFPLNFMGKRGDGTTSIRQQDQSVGSHIFGQSSFASHAICPQSNLVPVDDAIPLELVGPFGCGFQTGAGAVLNSLKVAKGSSLLVLGAGAVGLSAVMAAAHIAEASCVIVADLNDARLAIAKSVGATHTINGAAADFVGEIKAICPAGVNFVIDTTGHVPLVEKCVPLLAARGVLGLVAAYPLNVKFGFDVSQVMTTGKRIQGIMEGDSDIKTFIPTLLAHYKAGRFPVDKLIRYYDFADINLAIEASESGDVIKAVVRMP